MTELTTSTTYSGLSITIIKPAVPRKGSLLGVLSILHHMSFVSSSELSGSLSSHSLLVSLSLVKTVAEAHNCFHELVVGTSPSLYKMSLSLLSETSECVFACNVHRILSSFRTLLCKATTTTEGN
jgi:hypothetical protein